MLTIDITAMKHRPVHPRIKYVAGSTLDDAVVAQVRAAAAGKRTMVILDSDHSAAQVAAELKIYPEFVSPGCYLIVDDSNLGGHPGPAGARPGADRGPRRVVPDAVRLRHRPQPGAIHAVAQPARVPEASRLGLRPDPGASGSTP